jgi:hypothetical protein
MPCLIASPRLLSLHQLCYSRGCFGTTDILFFKLTYSGIPPLKKHINMATESETLGGLPGLSTHSEFVGESQTGSDEKLPADVLLGSFRGQILRGRDVFPIADFSFVFQSQRVFGKGNAEGKPFSMLGKFNIVGNGSARRILMAFTQRHFPPAAPAPPADPAANPPPTPSSRPPPSPVPPSTTFDDLTEFRCELVRDAVDFTNTHHGCGFEGEWFARQPNSTTIDSGKFMIWPTPSSERTGGFFAYTFITPTCGVEHSGSFQHWHGNGAEIRRVQEPAMGLGLKPGDVIKCLNGVPLPLQKRSTDISKAVKACDRPMVMLVWRDVTPAEPNEKDDDLETVDSVPDLTSRSSAADIISTVASMQSLTGDLKKDMMAEIMKKRTSLDSARQRGVIRRHSIVTS